jgi:hypothetical protein
MSTPVDPYAVPDHLAERFLQVKAMVEALQTPSTDRFYVMLTAYYIEGEGYRASGLTMSKTATPNLVQTQTGFVCDAFFRPELLTDHARRGKKVQRGLVAVRLAVELEDIIHTIPYHTIVVALKCITALIEKHSFAVDRSSWIAMARWRPCPSCLLHGDRRPWRWS